MLILFVTLMLLMVICAILASHYGQPFVVASLLCSWLVILLLAIQIGFIHG